MIQHLRNVRRVHVWGKIKPIQIQFQFTPFSTASDDDDGLSKASFATKAIHAGSNPMQNMNRELVSPISLSTTYKQQLPPHHTGFDYIRSGSPTVSNLEKCLASLEGTEYCLVYPSGQSAASNILSLLKPGDHVVTQNDLYHGIFNLFKGLKERNIEVDFVDASDSQNVKNALRSSTRLVWLETPTNPLMKIVDLKDITSYIKSSEPDIITVCDNTFMTPYFMRPAELGIDVVMHSCTKYIGGHSDVLMGCVCSDRKELMEALSKWRTLHGATSSPFDCYMVTRSLKTLEVRMERHMKNAMEIAKFLEEHPAVEKVFHPGLSSHPQHELSLRQCSGQTGMLSFYLKGHMLHTATTFISNLNIIHLAESLGGVETKIKMPSQMPRGNLSEEEMASQGITNGLIRVSVGIESVQDLIEDFKRGLDAVQAEGSD